MQHCTLRKGRVAILHRVLVILSGGNCAVLSKNKMAYMRCIIRFGIKTADQTMEFGGIGRKAKVDMERARAEVGMLLDRQKRGNVM